MNAQTINLKDYLTTSEAAEMLGVATETVKKYAQLGTLDGLKVGQQWLIPKSEVKRYNRERRIYNRQA